MDAIAEASAGNSLNKRHYDLYFREGPAGGIIWRYRDAGVALSPAGLEWRSGGQQRFTDWSTIDAIRVQTGHIPKSGTFGSCQITFRNGRMLTVTSLDSWGSADAGRLDDYAEFLQDLHAHLGEADRQRIRFIAGMTEGRQMFGKVAVFIGGAFFVLLPLVLLVITGEVKALFIMLGGAAFMIPAFRTVRRNEPRSYDPLRLDDDLFPHT